MSTNERWHNIFRGPFSVLGLIACPTMSSICYTQQCELTEKRSIE